MRNVLLWVVIAIAFWTVAVATLFLLGRKVAARRVLELVPASVALFRGLLADPRVPLGPLDDAIVCVLVVRYVVRRAGGEIVASHWRGDEATLRLLLRIAGVEPRRTGDPILT